MQSFVSVVCLLVSLTAANPVEIERRAFGGFSASAQQQQQQSSASSMNAYGGGMGGFGGGMGGMGGMGGFGAGGMSAYSSQSSSSYSSSSVISGFNGIASQIGAIQGMMAGGGFTEAIAMQEMTQLAASMQYALSASAGCGCFGQGSFMSSASYAFSSFYSLMMSMQSQFGGSFGSLLQPFGGMSNIFQEFCSSYQSSGYSMSSIIPQGLPSLMGGAIPGLANMVGFK